MFLDADERPRFHRFEKSDSRYRTDKRRMEEISLPGIFSSTFHSIFARRSLSTRSQTTPTVRNKISISFHGPVTLIR